MDDKIERIEKFREVKNEQIKKFQNLLKVMRKNNKYYLSILAIIKNETLYIEEWLNYYINMGVEHFYIIDNESTDNIQEILAPYIEKGYITYSTWEGRAQQEPAYAAAIEKYKYETRWLAIIDLDEFICPVEKISIADFMRDYEQYPALVLNWLMFDSNGHEKKPEGSVLENYTRIHEDYKNNRTNQHMKSIVDPLCVERNGIHGHVYSFNQYPVNTNFEEIKSMNFTREILLDKMRINHYLSKSKEEYEIKVAKGRVNTTDGWHVEKDSYDFPHTTHDYTILKHIGKDK